MKPELYRVKRADIVVTCEDWRRFAEHCEGTQGLTASYCLYAALLMRLEDRTVVTVDKGKVIDVQSQEMYRVRGRAPKIRLRRRPKPPGRQQAAWV